MGCIRCPASTPRRVCRDCELAEAYGGAGGIPLPTDPEAFLGDETHLCDVCNTVFYDLERLATHVCQPVATDGGEELVVVAANGRGRRAVHTDPDCKYVQEAANTREAPRSAFPSLDVCRRCEHGPTPPTEQDTSHFEALERAAEEGEPVTDGGEGVESEWRLVCLDCDFREEIAAEGHPRDGPPKEVERTVTTHKGRTDESHVVRVEGRPASRDEEIDPELVTDGGRDEVYVRCGNGGISPRRFHYDRDCSALAQSTHDIRGVATDAAPDRWVPCKYCDPEYEIDHAANNGGQMLTTVLEGMAPDDLAADGGTSTCRRRTCDREAVLTWTDQRGSVKTRCDRHALADGVDGIGDTRAETILEELSLEDLIERCEDVPTAHAPPSLSRLDGLGPATAAKVALAVDESRVAAAVRDQQAEVETDGGLEPAETETTVNSRMGRVTVRFPKELIDDLEQLVERGVYPNRSEAIRDGARHVRERYDRRIDDA